MRHLACVPLASGLNNGNLDTNTKLCSSHTCADKQGGARLQLPKLPQPLAELRRALLCRVLRVCLASATAIFDLVHAVLQPAGLHPCCGPRLRVLRLSPVMWPPESRDWLWQPLAAARLGLNTASGACGDAPGRHAAAGAMGGSRGALASGGSTGAGQRRQ